MSDLPPGWAESTIGEVTLPVEKHDPRKAPDSSIEYIDIGGIDGDRLRIATTKSYSGEEAPSRARQLVRTGDTALSTVRVNLTKTAIVPADLDGATASTGFSILRPCAAVVPEYLFHQVTARRFVDRLSAMQTGSSYPAVRDRDVRGMRVVIPPLPEQRRIVAAIEEHFSRLDAAEADLRVALGRTTTLMQSTLITLIPCVVVPNGWDVTTVDEAGATDLGRQRAPKYHSGESMRPYLRVANVFEDRLDLADVMEMDFDASAWARFRLIGGDILLNEGQSPHLVGRPAMYRGDPEAIAFTNSLIRFRAHEDVDPEWALLVFRRHLHSRRFMREASITTNIAHLALKRFRTVEFPKPPLREQRSLVERIRRELEIIDRQKASIVTAMTRLATLRRSVLAAAFSGQLVPQDPADEPALVLLEAIAAERTAAKPTRRKKAAL